MIEADRIKTLNNQQIRKGRYILYWMIRSCRSEYNHTLEYSIKQANALELPLLVLYIITNNLQVTERRHYMFMLEGLKETRDVLASRGIKLVIQKGTPGNILNELAANAAIVTTDRVYLREQRECLSRLIDSIKLPLIQVESDVVVPVETASVKEEYSAKTFRDKMRKILYDYLKPLKRERPLVSSMHLKIKSEVIKSTGAFCDSLKVDNVAGEIDWIHGGTSPAKRRLRSFIAHRLDLFAARRNDPAVDFSSHMSPYLRYGQISPLYIALEIMKAASSGGEVFLEQLIIRRELAFNFVYFNPNYDHITCLPDWALGTLGLHKKDRRDYLYSPEEFELAATHDPYWNAAQQELVVTGKMHGYIRMYWGKKILDWSRTPEEAFNTALYINNKYALDGCDPNSYCGVAWCFGKHDRPWGERPVFGKIRYMNDRGLERKFKMAKYIERIRKLRDKAVLE